MIQCSYSPHLQTSFFVINRNNQQHQYTPIHNLYKYSWQAVENQMLNSSALFINIIICHSYWFFWSKPDLIQLLSPIFQSNSRIYYCPMIVHHNKGIAFHKVSAQHQSTRNIKPLVTMQCKYWNFLTVGQTPHWLSILPSLHLCAWDKGGGGGLSNAAKPWKTTRINISRTILACLK